MRLSATTLLSSCLLIAGCAYLYGGDIGVGYFGPKEPEVSESIQVYPGQHIEGFVPGLNRKEFPGISIEVGIHSANEHGTEVVMFVVPTKIGIDPGDKLGDDKLTISIAVAPKVSGFTFNPSKTALTLGHKKLTPYKVDYSFNLRPSETGLIEKVVELSAKEPHIIQLRFDVPSNSFDEYTTLDISKALRHPGYSAIPVIRFKRVHWWNGRA